MIASASWLAGLALAPRALRPRRVPRGRALSGSSPHSSWADLADQIHRAASGVALNLCEGQRLTAGNQRRHYELAHGSANEVKGALDLAEAWGWVADTTAPRRTLDRLLALLWRLTHPRTSFDDRDRTTKPDA